MLALIYRKISDSRSPSPKISFRAVQLPSGFALNPPPWTCDKLSPTFTYVNGTLVLVTGARGMVFARRTFCRSTRRTLESDPGSGIRVPSPDLTPDSPAVLPGVDSAAPKSIRNLAIFPDELHIAIHCCEPSPLCRGSKSNPTDVAS